MVDRDGVRSPLLPGRRIARRGEPFVGRDAEVTQHLLTGARTGRGDVGCGLSARQRLCECFHGSSLSAMKPGKRKERTCRGGPHAR